MLTRMFSALFVVALAVSAHAQQQPPKGQGKWLPSGDVVGFTQKEQPFAVERVVPGVVGALLLTDEQKQKLQAALAETIHDPALRDAAQNIKSKPNATEADKEAARRKAAEARQKLQDRVGAILTEEQRTLVGRLNNALAEAQNEVRENMQAQFASAKGNDEQMKQLQEQMRSQVIANFKSRASTLMTAAQQAGFEKAAADQAAADAAPPKKKE